VRASWDVLKIERLREGKAQVNESQRQEREARSEQADRVAAWLDLREGLVIRNGGELPVYDVVVSVCDGSGHQVGGNARLAVVPPGQETVRIPGNGGGGHVMLGMETREQGRASVEFRDTARRKWLRDGYGRLHPKGCQAMGGARGSVSWSGTTSGEKPPDEAM
jgi:hypothetical protein